MKIFNSMTKKKEKFVPINGNNVTMYACGVTVYDLSHIGHARQAIVYSMMADYLRYKGYNVKYVRNYTDVDDKIIKRANEYGKNALEFSKEQIEETEKDMAGLHITEADVKTKASEYIDKIIEFVERLIEKGYAYKTEKGDVYYSVRKFKEYGKLSHRNVDDMLNGVRIELEEGKKDPIDFALWKSAKPGEIYWESPWGKGRPGWHIECSVMAKKYLADEIDIHAGGEDLIFPHHENEIAQSEAANGVPFAKYWMHNAFLNIDNKKMSKSLGNFFTVRDIAKEYDLQVLRFFMLSAHYRNPINFSHELMESAKNSLDRIVTSVMNLTHLEKTAADLPMTDEEQKVLDLTKDIYKKFEAAMDDDFNTADAISAVFELVKLANSNSSETDTKAYITALKESIVKLADILGLNVVKEEELLDEDVEALINERQQARKDRNFARADEIRDELTAKGIVLEDTREGVRWKRA